MISVIVTVPDVVLLTAVAPPAPSAMTAETVPAWKSYDEPTRLPLRSVPPWRVTAPTCWAKPPRSKMPPLTVTTPEAYRRLRSLSSRMPLLMNVPPV